MKKTMHRKEYTMNNRGFTIVELLVCVSILAIAVIPLMKSMSSATRTNSRAQSLQNATSLAEDVMEEVKSTTISNIGVAYNGPKLDGSGDPILDADGNQVAIVKNFSSLTESNFLAKTDSEKVEAVDTEAGALADGDGTFLTGGTADDPFYILYKKNAMSTQGEKFNVLAIISPKEYKNGSTSYSSSASGSENVLNVNSIKLPDLESIDTLSQTVLTSNDINRYDAAAIDYFTEVTEDGHSVQIAKKEITIDKSGNAQKGFNHAISVKCQIKYTAAETDSAGNPIYFVRDLYQGTFPSYKDPVTSQYQDVKSNIYIFFERLTGTTYPIVINVDDKSTNGPKDSHNVYFSVQGSGAIPDISNTKVLINDASSNRITFSGASVSLLDDDGNIEDGDFSFISNLTKASDYGHIYNPYENNIMRMYSVDVILTKEADGNTYASLHSSKSAKDSLSSSSTSP